VDTGGLLTNSVLPSGLAPKRRAEVVVPSGVKEKAQLGLSLLKEAVIEFTKINPKGISNSEAAGLLGLRGDYGGGSKDYLSYSVIGLLMREGRLERDPVPRKHICRVK
jgi:uncharacterized protein